MELEIFTSSKEAPKTYGEFMDAYEAEIDVLETFDRDGCEIDDGVEIPLETAVIGFSRRGGCFDLELYI
jgi:hypothetical protein